MGGPGWKEEEKCPQSQKLGGPMWRLDRQQQRAWGSPCRPGLLRTPPSFAGAVRPRARITVVLESLLPAHPQPHSTSAWCPAS